MSSQRKSWVGAAVVTLALGLLLAAPAAQAAVLYWDTSSSSGIQAGSGTWSISSTEWATGTGGTTRQGWTNGDDADFYTSGASTITVSSSVSVGNITFAGSGYTISGGTLQLTAGTITTSYSATIGSVLAGSVALTKSGAADLILTGSNTYSGLTSISAGTLQLGSGGTTGSIGNTTSVSDSGVLEFDRSDSSVTFSQAISGGGGLVQAGTGTLILTGSNTYSGLTSISAGTLQLGSGGTTGSIGGTTSVSDSGVLAFDRSDNISFAPAISGSGSLIQMGSGTLTLTAAANTYTGPTLVNGGSLVGTTANIPMAVTLANNANVTFNQAVGGTLNQPVSGAGSLTKQGAGVLTVGTVLGYQGTTTVAAGTLQLGATTNLPTVVHLAMKGSGSINNGATIPDSSGNGFNAAMNGSGASYVAGGPFGLGINSNGGLMRIPANPAFDLLTSWTDSIWVNIGSGSTGDLVACRDYDPIHGFVEYFDGTNLNAAIPGAGGGWLNQSVTAAAASLNGTGWHMVTFTAQAGNYQFYLDGSPVGTPDTTAGTPEMVGLDDNNVNNHISDLTIGGYGDGNMQNTSFADFQLYNSVLTAAQIQQIYNKEGVPIGGPLPATTPLVVNAGATFDLAGISQTIASLSDGSGGGTVTNSSSTSVTLTLTPAAGTSKFSGAIQNGTASGQTSLTINGAGIVQLDGNNTFTGPTNLLNGTLSGAGTLASAVTVAAGAALAPGDNAPGSQSGGFGALTLGGLTLNSNSQLVFDITSGSSDEVVVNGAVSLGSGLTLDVVDPAGPLGHGHYPLILASGAITGLTPSTFTISGAGTNIASIASITTGGSNELVLNVVGVDVWTGAHSTAWNTTTANWAGPTTYSDGDGARFDDSAGSGVAVVPGSVIIAGTVQPLAITVSNTSLAYTFSGAGSIAGSAPLTKQGSGSLEINMANNTYNGGTNLIAGVLQVDASSTVSSGTLQSGPLGVGPVALSGGTLQDDGNGRTLANGVTISGAVTLAGLTLGPQGLGTPNTVTLTGTPTINVTAPATIADEVCGNLVMAGPSTLTLTAATNSLSGTTEVSGGTLVGTVANIATPVTLANNANVTFNQAVSGTLSIPVGGTGSFTKAGGGLLVLGTPATYQGPTKISSGTLQISAPVGLPTVVSYTFNGPLGPISNGASIPDSSGNGNNATMQGISASYVAGQFGQGIQPNGGYVSAPSTPSINGLQTWTDSVWININNSYAGNYGSGVLVATRDDDPVWGFVESYDGTTLSAAIPWAGGGNWLSESFSCTTTLSPNTWHMFTYAVSSTSVNIYVDGVLATSTAIKDTPQMVGAGQTSALTVGGRPGYGGISNASLEDFTLYNSALSAAQIQLLYQTQLVPVGGGLPNTPVQIAGGAVLDLHGLNATLDSLADAAGSGGTVTTSVSGVFGPIALTLAPAGTTTFSGVIQNGAGQIFVTVNGPGTQVLAGSNTYTGATTINGGVLEIAASGVYSGGFAVNGGTLAVAAPGAIDSTSALSGNGTVLLAPGGSMIARNFGGNVLIAGGTLNVAPSATLALNCVLVTAGTASLGSGQMMALGNGGLIIAPGANATFNMTGGSLVQGGSGDGGANWWGGSVNVGDPSAGGPGGTANPAVLAISGGTLQAGISGIGGGVLQVGVGGGAGIVNQSGGVVNVQSWGIFTVGGAALGDTAGQGTYNLSAGTLTTGSFGRFSEIGLAGGTGVVHVTGGVWNIAGDGYGGLLNIGSGNATDTSSSLNGDPAGTGSVVISGGQVHAFGGITVGDVYSQGGSAGLLSLQGGILDLTSGTVSAPMGGMILVGSGGTLVASSGTLQNVTEILGNATLSGTTASGTPMPLTKTGTGVLVMSGSNTYTGGTTVSEGTIEVADTGALPTTGIINVGRSGTVSLLGLLVIPGVVGPDNSQAAMDTAAEPANTLAVATTFPASAGVSVASGGGGVSLDDTEPIAGADPAAAVPEPSTMAMVLAGAVCLVLLARCRRRRE